MYCLRCFSPAEMEKMLKRQLELDATEEQHRRSVDVVSNELDIGLPVFLFHSFYCLLLVYWD